jgi:hypothetical protein
MKPVWIGVVLVLVYGLFSIKSQAAEGVFTAHSELRESGGRWNSPCVNE